MGPVILKRRFLAPRVISVYTIHKKLANDSKKYMKIMATYQLVI